MPHTGSSHQRLAWPSNRAVAPASASESLAGSQAVSAFTRPTRAPGDCARIDWASQSVPEQQVVRGGNGGTEIGDSRRVPSLKVAEPGGDARLVQRGPVVDPVVERRGDMSSVRGEVLGGFACRPAAQALQRLRVTAPSTW